MHLRDIVITRRHPHPPHPHCLLAALAAALSSLSAAHAGPLDPPSGPITGTHKTLTEVEPRIAISSTNTPGDADSLFRISHPGSYYLTGNITGLAGRYGIEIAASNVTLDLNGFTVAGVYKSISGIAITEGTFNAVTIRNGHVTGWGGAAVSLPSGVGHVVEGVTASHSANGIEAGVSSVVRACTSFNNPFGGITVGNNSVVSDCTARHTTQAGFLLGDACVLTNCTARENTIFGASAGSGCAITACSFNDNGGDGLTTFFGCTITACSAAFNGITGFNLGNQSAIIDCTAVSNTIGIRVAQQATVRGNKCSANAAYGIHATFVDNRIEDNDTIANAVGYFVEASGNFLNRNTAKGNQTNWQIAAGNACYVVTTTISGPINGNAGGTPPGSSEPNANFTY